MFFKYYPPPTRDSIIQQIDDQKVESSAFIFIKTSEKKDA